MHIYTRDLLQSIDHYFSGAKDKITNAKAAAIVSSYSHNEEVEHSTHKTRSTRQKTNKMIYKPLNIYIFCK